MTQKMRKTFIMIVMAALIICLMAASLTYTFTYGLYTGGKFDSDNSPYDDLIEFVGAREYTVRSPEELIQAIEDGYSNIVISEDAEQPFVITEGVTDVTANLVLNLNGNVVVRNSRNPMLDVQTNVSVVLVYDSKNTGAFYNPVGSSLMASGGSLTVGSGGYESGPRAEEYENGTAAGELTSQPSDVAIFTRGGITSPDAVDRANQLFYQEIEASSGLVPKTTGRYYQETAGSDYAFVPQDTFLVYTVEENCFIGEGTSSGGVTFEEGKLYVDAELEEGGSGTQITATEFKTPLCDVASCDFYYYYPIGDDDNDGYEDYAVIYGYWDVMKLASNDGGTAENLREKGLVYPYGAVRMVEGEGIVRGGTFYNHFDVANTYGIYAEGGRLSVSRNTAFETTFSSGGEGVCIRSSGESAELTISGGSFSSEIGNTIEMQGGTMNVTAGKFTKSGGKGIGSGSGEEQAQQQRDNQTAMIDMQGGELTINGSDSNSVTMTARSAVDGDTLENVFGILAHSGGMVSVGGCTFDINGNYSAGVLSYDGTINLNNNTVIKVTETHPDNKITSAGVSSEHDTTSASSTSAGHPINMSGNVQIESNGLGITARGKVNVESGTTTVTTECATGIVVSGDASVAGGEQQATLTVSSTGTLSVVSTINSTLGWVDAPGHEGTGSTNKNNGVYVENGSIDASTGTLNVTHTGVAGNTPSNTEGAATKSYAVYVTGETASGSQTTEVKIGAGEIKGTNAGGVYVENGAVSLGASSKNVTINTGGWNNTQDQIVSTQGTYASAVYANGGTVTMNGTITINSAAIGIVATAADTGTGTGAVTIESGTTTIKAYRSTGVYIRGGSLTNDGTLDVTSTIKNSTGGTANTAAEAYKWAGADIEDDLNNSNIYNGVFVNGGSLESTGTLNVTFTGVQNAAFNTETQEGKVNTSYLNQQIKSYAVRVDNGNAIIVLGEIENGVGGGVLVNGGTVELGAVDAENDDLIVSTTGSNYDDQTHYVTGNQWQYDWTLTGGHAVAVEGGTLNIYSGTYTAQMGNGILVRNLASDSTQNTVTVKDGIFEGYNGSGRRVGPGAFYALKVMGGPLTLNINGGTFGKALVNDEVPSTNGGAFVMGNPDAKERATVNVTNASFNSYNSDTFAVFRYVDVKFKSSASENISMTVTKASTDTNNYAAIGVQNDFVYNNDNHPNRGSTITIEDGTYSGGFGIWYGSPMDKVNISGGEITGTSDGILYSASGAVENSLSISDGTITGNIGLNLAGAPAASGAVTISGGKITGSSHGVYYGASGAVNDGLLIEGGTITGSNGSGLYFAVNPWQDGGTNNVAIVGGTFNGKPEKKGSNLNPFYINGAISAPSSGATNIDYSGLGKQIRLGDILKTHTGDGKVGYVKENLAWNGNTPLGDNYNYSIAVTVSSLSQVTIIP